MRSFRLIPIAALVLSAAGCSLTEKAQEPIVIVKTIPIEVSPEARKPCPENQPKPTRRLSDEETFTALAVARTTRNICEARRAAAVASADAAGAPR
jgi:hypothetical protein